MSSGDSRSVEAVTKTKLRAPRRPSSTLPPWRSSGSVVSTSMASVAVAGRPRAVMMRPISAERSVASGICEVSIASSTAATSCQTPIVAPWDRSVEGARCRRSAA